MAQSDIYDQYGNLVEGDQPSTTTAPGYNGGGIGAGTPTGTTIANANDTFDASRVPSGVPVEWAKDFISRNPGDYHRLSSAYGGGQTGGGSSLAQQWNATSPSGPTMPDWYQSWFTDFRNQANQAQSESKAKGDSLYNTLLEKINQSKVVNENDPVIRAQADAFSAAQERSKRGYLADLAESSGPNANLRGETRLASERVGSANAANVAGLMASELQARRQEIAQALSGALGQVNAQQAAALQQELAVLDQVVKEQGLGLQGQALSQDWQRALMSNDLGLRQLGFQDWDRQQYWDAVRSGVLS